MRAILPIPRPVVAAAAMAPPFRCHLGVQASTCLDGMCDFQALGRRIARLRIFPAAEVL
jgi:hypothetical protein